MSEDEPSNLGDTIMDTDNMESVSVSIISNESKLDDTLKKKRKSKRKSDGYKSRKRQKSSKTPKSDEYEVEMIIDHKTDEEVRF